MGCGVAGVLLCDWKHRRGAARGLTAARLVWLRGERGRWGSAHELVEGGGPGAGLHPWFEDASE